MGVVCVGGYIQQPKQEKQKLEEEKLIGQPGRHGQANWA